MYLNKSMFRTWLLIVWIGADSDFTLIDSFKDLGQCNQRRSEIVKTLDGRFTVICTQDMQEKYLLKYQKQEQQASDK